MLTPHRTFLSNRASSRGFTLIELLVVISIIGILAGIAIPVFNSVRTKSYQLKCNVNLKQWGVAILAYSGEHNGGVQWSAWPSIGDSNRYYEPYFANIGTASRDTKSVLLKGRGTWYTELFRFCPWQVYLNNTGNNAPVGYAMSRPNPPVANSGQFPLFRANTPSQLLLMIDGNGTEIVNGPADLITVVKPLTLQGSDLRHGGLINVLFGDGHVQGYRWDELNPNVTNNPGQVARLNNWFQLYPQ